MGNSDIVILNGKVYTPSGIITEGFLRIRDGSISEIGTATPEIIQQTEKVVDAEDNLVLPGFMDIHVNGGGGHMAIEATPEAMLSIAEAHARFGTTSMVLTTITTPTPTLSRVLEVVASLDQGESRGAEILGVHLEGPFINPERAGAHNRKYLRPPSREVFDALMDRSNGCLRMLSLAPELEGSMELIRHAVAAGVVVGLAHSNADYEVTLEAIDAGMTICAHLFNSMPPLAHRAPGPIGAFLSTPDTFVELISDGYHVHPAVMDLAIAAKGPDHVALVTDAVTPAGTDMMSFSIDGLELLVKGKSCFTSDGDLAGSALTMDDAVKVVSRQTRCSLEDTVRMASLSPATALGIESKKGSLEVGKDGDVVVATEDLRVITTIVGGRQVFPQQT